MFTHKNTVLKSIVFTALLAGSILLSACAGSANGPVKPTDTVAAQPTAVATPDSVSDDWLQISLDTGNIAGGFETTKVPAVSADTNAPYWKIMPEYTVLTLQEYPINNHLMKPKIFIYPLAELGEYNEGAGQIVTALQTVLQAPQELENMPFLPMFNAAQIFHTHVRYLDFKNGMGLRYLTMFSQGIVPVNNSELIYTYQGVTSDGKYYVAAVLPINHPSLPGDGTVTGNEPPEFTSDFLAYLNNVVKSLNAQAGNTFTPDLAQLDAMMSSLEIK